MDTFSRFWQTGTVMIVVPFVFMLLAKLFPYAPASSQAEKSSLPYTELRKKYAKWELSALVPFFVFCGGAGYLIYHSLRWILYHSTPTLSSDRFLLLPDEAFFMLPAIFLGIFVGAIPTDLLYRALLQERYAEYTHYGNLRVGFDSWRVVRITALFLIPLLALLTCLGMDCYARFTDDKVITNRFWGIGETEHAYSQITSIRQIQSFKAPNGNIVERPYSALHFNDGSNWSTKNQYYRFSEDSNLNQQREAELILFITNKTGKQVEILELSDED
jgi:hypothetical protein